MSMAWRIRRSHRVLICVAAVGFAAAASAEPAPAPFPAMPAAPTALAGDFRAALLTIPAGELESSGFEAPSFTPGLQAAVVAAAVRADKERLSRPPLETDAVATADGGGPVDRRVALAFADFGAADANALAYGAHGFVTASMRAAVVRTAEQRAWAASPTLLAYAAPGD